MKVTLYEYADEVLAKEARYAAEDPDRRRSPIAAFIDAIRADKKTVAAKLLLTSPVFQGAVRDGKLVISARKPLGHIEVPPGTFPGLHGSRGWAREAGKRLAGAR